MTHTVKPGETLSAVARLHGLTLTQLLAANPRFRANPNRVRIGDVLNVARGADAAARVTPLPIRPQPPEARALGALSERYETSGRGPGTVSGGHGDPGGVSYGSYQMTSKPRGGTAKRFVSDPGCPFRETFAQLTPGTEAFTRTWRTLARTHREAFQASQHDFIKRTHFDPLVRKILHESGLDVLTRCHVLQDVIWSTAVQHGPGSRIPQRALATVVVPRDHPEFDRQFIAAIYAERGRTKADGGLVHFPRVGAALRPGLLRRFRDEGRQALELLEQELPV